MSAMVCFGLLGNVTHSSSLLRSAEVCLGLLGLLRSAGDPDVCWGLPGSA